MKVTLQKRLLALSALSTTALLLANGCGTVTERETIASLRNVTIEIKEEQIEGSLEKAMESYRKFLEETPESAMTPEAIRRLADLKIEKEYGTVVGTSSSTVKELPEEDEKPAGIATPDMQAKAPVVAKAAGVTAAAIAAPDENKKDHKKNLKNVLQGK